MVSSPSCEKPLIATQLAVRCGGNGVGLGVRVYYCNPSNRAERLRPKLLRSKPWLSYWQTRVLVSSPPTSLILNSSLRFKGLGEALDCRAGTASSVKIQVGRHGRCRLQHTPDNGWTRGLLHYDDNVTDLAPTTLQFQRDADADPKTKV